MSKVERLVIAILWINVFMDLLGNYMNNTANKNIVVYNAITPIEIVLTLGIYQMVSHGSRLKKALKWLMIMFLTLVLYDYLTADGWHDFHEMSYTVGCLGLVVVSYFFLRFTILGKGEVKTLVFWFAVANIFFYALAVSIFAAEPIVQQLERDTGQLIMNLKNTAYSIWTLLIIFGILWKLKKNIFSF
ncbi:MAG: hypothetical protein JJ975_09645 [Bacteroidia bacterium]|nr:hypothetical protein [Bacteroidia bacterium]